MFTDYDTYGFHGGNDVVLRTLLGRPPRTVEQFIAELASADRGAPVTAGASGGAPGRAR
jgi:hypothetical protein